MERRVDKINAVITDIEQGRVSEDTLLKDEQDSDEPFSRPTDDCVAVEGMEQDEVDEDGDSYSWMNAEMTPYEGNGCISSASYINSAGALTPDNWLITPATANWKPP